MGAWYQPNQLPPTSFICGFCGNKVASDKGYCATSSPNGGSIVASIYICPACQGPTTFTEVRQQLPGIAPGEPVEHVPENLNKLYNEARASAGIEAFTATGLICRKMLMHIAVEQGASPGANFVSYVEYLSAQNFIPPNGKGWVDHIRTLGNEANHEIRFVSRDEAFMLIEFIQMLLRFIYDFPAKVPGKP